MKNIYCYITRIAFRKHSTKEILWICPQGEVIFKPFEMPEVEPRLNYYKAAARKDEEAATTDVVITKGGDGKFYLSEVKKEREVENAIFRSSYEDLECVCFYDEQDPKEYKKLFLKILDREDPEVIRKYYPGACYIVTRSFKPDNKPWLRCGRRTYLWLVSLEERDVNKGRRIEWGGDTILFASRKEALNWLYSK